MSAVVWKLNNVLVSTLNISDLSLSLSNMAVDRLTFKANRNVDVADLFAPRSTVTLTRDNVPFFKGVVNRPPRSGSPQTESHSYEVCGGWWYLERLSFQQTWMGGNWVGTTWTPAPMYKSRVILGQSTAGAAQTSGAVIREIIAYAASCGVPIAAGTIDSGCLFPWDEVLDLTCAEAIRRVARWTPDYVGWFDYSQPVPTFNWRRIANLPARTVAGTRINQLDITVRDDLSTPAVVLKYEITAEVNGASMVSLVEDAWPIGATGRELGAITQTIQLSGGSTNTVHQSQRIRVADMPADPNDIAWWIQHRPELESENIEYLMINGAKRNGYKLPYELLEGSIQDWMVNPIWNPNFNMFVNNPYPHGHAIRAMPETIKAQAHYKIKDPSGKASTKVESREISVTVTVTNANYPDMSRTNYTKTYYKDTQTTSTGGESVPAGIARTLYEAINRPQYDGTIILLAEDVDAVVAMGCVVNISGLKSDWETMVSPVQSVQFSLDSGRTTLRIGPADHLSIQDLTEYMRLNRTRKPATSNVDRISGGSNSGAVELSSQRPRSDATAGLGVMGEWITVETAQRLDAATNQLQHKTRDIKVLAAQPESEWTMWPEGGQGEPCRGTEAP